jgi:hypothetical protein
MKHYKLAMPHSYDGILRLKFMKQYYLNLMASIIAAGKQTVVADDQRIIDEVIPLIEGKDQSIDTS